MTAENYQYKYAQANASRIAKLTSVNDLLNNHFKIGEYAKEEDLRAIQEKDVPFNFHACCSVLTCVQTILKQLNEFLLAAQKR